MVHTRSTGRQESAEPAHAEQSRSTTQPAAQTPRNETASDEERALLKQLEELQREERVAQLKRKVDEWKARREAGYPDDLANPLGAPIDVDTTHSERREIGKSSGPEIV